jgi:hypothetical protein
VLQYVDDTLIILEASVPAAECLKKIMDLFALATGLVINFKKSTMVMMHVSPEVVADMQAALGCHVEGFPRSILACL